MSYFSLFQSPHPVRGATGSRSCWPPSQCHFNPRTPRGVRLPTARRFSALCSNFNTRTPRGVRLGQYRRVLGGIDFNPRTPRGVRLVRTANMARLTAISIHAPREGCDPAFRACLGEPGVISIHAPREGCDLWPPVWIRRGALFQSTHPARGATQRTIRAWLS